MTRVNQRQPRGQLGGVLPQPDRRVPQEGLDCPTGLALRDPALTCAGLTATKPPYTLVQFPQCDGGLFRSSLPGR
jgi:hypothetical protein